MPKIDILLLCGGKGTRFRPITQDTMPKSLWKVGGKELIRYTTDGLTPKLIENLIFCVNHLDDRIKSWADRQQYPYKLKFSNQDAPGIPEAVKSALRLANTQHVAICNTDEIRDGFNFESAINFHFSSQATSTMVVTKSNCLFRHRKVELDDNSLITSSELKPSQFTANPNVVGTINTGFIIINRDLIGNHSMGLDWGTIIDRLIEKRLLYANLQPNLRYFNVGTASELEEAEKFLNLTNSPYAKPLPIPSS
jgi:NDP-sugar pyrophosphorylase family protein